MSDDYRRLITEIRRLREVLAGCGHDEWCPMITKGEPTCYCLRDD